MGVENIGPERKIVKVLRLLAYWNKSTNTDAVLPPTLRTHRATKMLEVTQRHEKELAKALSSRRADLERYKRVYQRVAYARVALSASLPPSLFLRGERGGLPPSSSSLACLPPSLPPLSLPSSSLPLPVPRETLPHFTLTLTLTLTLSRRVPRCLTV